MRVEVLVEERSAEEALKNIFPNVLGQTHSCRIHAFRGKRDLLKKLPARLKGYPKPLPPDWRILVLVDADDRDCLALKKEMEQAAHQAGLLTKSAVPAGSAFQVLNRVVVKELETWFLGDVQALRRAFRRLPRTLDNRARHRNPDAIRGGAAEALARELRSAGYHKADLSKVTVARKISVHMAPDRNRSRSFQVFRRGLLELVGREPAS